MRFRSTRSNSPALTLSEAIQMSLAPDGGLYVPESFPVFEIEDFDGLESCEEIGVKLLEPFFKSDVLLPELGEICREAFNFPTRLNYIGDDTAVLELFHGPTAAFKDVGARFLASCVSRLPGRRTVLVATSGDTGSAVAAAFHEHSEIKVVILFPKNKVSLRQQQQLTCWGDSVRAFAVRGDFDDCQRIVKTAFKNREWAEAHGLLSANSINLGRMNFGFDVTINKGIALGSGMGGSAASAVGGVVAANSLLKQPLSEQALLEYALLGEQAASGAAHADNIAPCLFGCMTLVLSVNPVRYVSLPVPANILTVLVHPQLRIDTHNARRILEPSVPLDTHVRQSANLGGFIAGCFRDDVEMIRHSFCDLVIEPQRESLIPGFADVKAAAMDCGSIGASISGSGPSVFAWVTSPESATQVRDAMVQTFRSHSIEVDSWISPVSQQGATIIR